MKLWLLNVSGLGEHFWYECSAAKSLETGNSDKELSDKEILTLSDWVWVELSVRSRPGLNICLKKLKVSLAVKKLYPSQ